VANGQECTVPQYTAVCQDTLELAPAYMVDDFVNNYLGDVEKAIGYIWPLVINRINIIAEKADFTVCDDCTDLLRHTLCSSFLPSCGFVECFESYADDVNTTCPLRCAISCNNNNDTTAITNCYMCEANCIAQIIFDNCGSKMMSKSMCNSLVEVCSCTSQYDSTVCQWFSDEGYTIPYPGSNPSCENVQGWCSSTNNKRETAASAGVFPINNFLAINMPMSIGEQSIPDPISITNPPVNISGLTTGGVKTLVPLAFLSLTALLF